MKRARKRSPSLPSPSIVRGQSKKQRDQTFKVHDLNTEIDQCKQYVVQFPFVYTNVTVGGIIQPLLFMQYIYKVYNGLRLLRPDMLVPLSGIRSMKEGCRILEYLVQQFPCMFLLR